MMHHRRNGQFLTQTQEEVILIAAFGFFWLGQRTLRPCFPCVFAEAGPNAHSDPGGVASVHCAAGPWRARASTKHDPVFKEAKRCVRKKRTWVHAHGAETVRLYRRFVVLRR